MGQHWDDRDLSATLANAAHSLIGAPRDLDPLVELAANPRIRFVLAGESSHGTHEFYRLRAELTKRLIALHGYAAIAVEADWPDAYRVNRFVRGQGRDTSAIDALSDFERFPSWMWRNHEVAEFVGWLRRHNDALPLARRVGFYGLDLYSLHGSVNAVLAYLDREDPEAARQARERYACFDRFPPDPQHYGHATTLGDRPGCEQEVIAQLMALQQRRRALLHRDGIAAEDAYFEAEQNARVVMNAEEYYRAMFVGRVGSWNLRDTHMADTLDALQQHLAQQQRLTHEAHAVDDVRAADVIHAPPRIVVWAHNSHVGDARATEFADVGEINIGQLVRERHPGASLLIGQSTHAGSVTAASDWGAPAERMRVRPALSGSYEEVMHLTGLPAFALPLCTLGRAADALREPRLQRAIGVVYQPETERASHYYHVRLAEQFDALLHVDESNALRPLDRESRWDRSELPETYPSGI